MSLKYILTISFAAFNVLFLGHFSQSISDEVTISGQILDRNSGKPIAGATVKSGS
ncbi:MAG: hypothetical protein RIC57_11930 [Balneola sp.]